MSESSATFYAKWSPKKVTINWMLDGITAADDNYTKTFYYGDTVTLPTLTKDGMEFMGWYLDENYKTPITEKNIKTINTDITVYPLFAPLVNFTIAGTSVEQFGIVISEHASVDVKYNAEQLREFLKKRTGYTLSVITDSISAGAHEIIIGMTSRSDSEALALDDYKISVKNGNLVIDAGHYQGVSDAFKAFLEVYGNPMSDVAIPADYTLSGKSAVPVIWTDNGSAKELLLDKYNEEYIGKSFTSKEKAELTAALNALRGDNRSEYKLVWSDEFDDLWKTGDINYGKWDHKRFMDPGGVSYREDYSTFKAENGLFTLSTDMISPDSRKNPVNGKSYKMTQVSTATTMNYRYGYVEMRAEIPFMGKGEWPSFWATSHSAKLAHPIAPEDFMEIDIFEQFSTKDTVSPCLHMWPMTVGNRASLTANHSLMGAAIGGSPIRDFVFPSQEAAWGMHTYGMLWTEHIIAFSVDGVFYYAYGLDDFFDFGDFGFKDMSRFRDQSVAVILNNQMFTEVKGNREKDGWAKGFADGITDDMFPLYYNIEYIRLYQIEDYGDLWLGK